MSELRRFIGMVNYLAKFLPNLASVMQPLHTLLKQDTPWNWSLNENKAYEEIKELLCKTPILTFYDPNKKLTVECDASNHGLGSVLLQEGRPVAYASRRLAETEKHYTHSRKRDVGSNVQYEKIP